MLEAADFPPIRRRIAAVLAVLRTWQILPWHRGNSAREPGGGHGAVRRGSELRDPQRLIVPIGTDATSSPRASTY